MNDIITQCMGAVHQAANGDPKVQGVVGKADEFFTQQRQRVRDLRSLALLDGLVPPMFQYKDSAVDRLEKLLAPPKAHIPPADPQTGGGGMPPVKKVIRSYNRSIIFPAKQLETMEDVDDYVEKIREQLKQLLKNCDGIQLK